MILRTRKSGSAKDNRQSIKPTKAATMKKIVFIVIASLAVMHFGHSIAEGVVSKAVSKQAATLSSI
jgi:hypothetical protein